MNIRQSNLATALILFATLGFAAEAISCPVTLSDGEYQGPVDAWSGKAWYGNEKLAVMLPEDDVWPTTKAGHLIAIKFFWWSEGFEPGMEDALSVELAPVGSLAQSAKVSRVTNAHADDLGGWTMLTGMDFPEPGCWEVTGRYHGEELSFVVKVIDVEAYNERKRGRQ